MAGEWINNLDMNRDGKLVLIVFFVAVAFVVFLMAPKAWHERSNIQKKHKQVHTWCSAQSSRAPERRLRQFEVAAVAVPSPLFFRSTVVTHRLLQQLEVFFAHCTKLAVQHNSGLHTVSWSLLFLFETL